MENKRLIESLERIKVEVEKSRVHIGMCTAIERMSSGVADRFCSDIEGDILHTYLTRFRPFTTKIIKFDRDGSLRLFRPNNSTYWWQRSNRQVRINWLDKQITKLKNIK